MANVVDIIQPIEYGLAFTDEQKSDFRESIADALEKLNTDILDASQLGSTRAIDLLSKEALSQILQMSDYPVYASTTLTPYSGGMYNIFYLLNEALKHVMVI